MLRDRAENLRHTLKLLSRDGRMQSVWVELGKLHEPGQRLRFSPFGHPVCKRSCCRAMVAGQSSVQFTHKSSLEGALTVPQDARRENIVPRRLPDQSDDVERCFFKKKLVLVAQDLPDANPSSNSGRECPVQPTHFRSRVPWMENTWY